MTEHLFQSEIVTGANPTLRIRVTKGAPMAELASRLQAFLEKSFAENISHYVVDLKEVPYPSANFIALLIANTARARHLKGELTIENLSTTARDNLLTFSALSYLSDSRISQVPAPAFPEEDAKIAGDDDDLEAFSLVDIAEPALVHTFSNELRAGSAPKPATEEAFSADEEVESFSLRVESLAAKLYQICDFVVEHARLAGMKEKEIGKIRIAVYEACLNVIEHAYHSKPENWIDVSVHYTPKRFVIHILDHGLSFELKPPQEYDVQEAVNARRTGGFGMHIIRKAVDSQEYRPDAINGNRLILIKNLR